MVILLMLVVEYSKNNLLKKGYHRKVEYMYMFLRFWKMHIVFLRHIEPNGEVTKIIYALVWITVSLWLGGIFKFF